MSLKEARVFTAEEIEELAEQAGKNAMNHFKYGLTCSECVFKGFLDLGLVDLPDEVVAVASGYGGGMGETFHTCGAVNGGMMAIGSVVGRKNPYAGADFEARVAELHNTENGIYLIHGKYIRRLMKNVGTIECRDLRINCDLTTPEGKKDAARFCKKLIGLCAREATRAALTEGYLAKDIPDEDKIR